MRPRFDPWVRKIPWRREWYLLQYSCLYKSSMYRGAGGLQSMESQRAGHDWVLTLLLSLFFLHLVPHLLSVLKPLMAPLLYSYSVDNFAFYFTKKNEAIRREHTQTLTTKAVYPLVSVPINLAFCSVTINILSTHLCKASSCICVLNPCSLTDPRSLLHWNVPSRKNLPLSGKGGSWMMACDFRAFSLILTFKVRFWLPT